MSGANLQQKVSIKVDTCLKFRSFQQYHLDDARLVPKEPISGLSPSDIRNFRYLC